MTSRVTSLLNTAKLELSQGRWEKIGAIAKELVVDYPKAIDGHYLMGKVAQRENRLNDAAIHLSNALSIDSSRYDIAIDLAECHVQILENDKALELINQYSDTIANSPRHLTNAGSCLVNMGLTEKAVPLYERALQLQPDITLFKSNLANAMEFMGDFERATKLYKELIEQNPHHRYNHYQISRLKTAKNHDHIKNMLATLENDPKPAHENIFAYYALGKEYEDLGEWDNAFKYYNLAGNAAKSTSNYNTAQDTQLLMIVVNTYDEAWFNRTKANTTSYSPTPIFILGLPRTGSTLLERILSSHSKLQSIGETQFLPQTLKYCTDQPVSNQISPELLSNTSQIDPKVIADEYLSRVNYLLDGSQHFIEKLPYNSLFVGLITKAFPDSKILVVDRDPIDTCFSIYKQVFTWAYKFSYDLETLANYFIEHQKMMQHWIDQTANQIYVCKYETLVSDPESEVKNILSKLDLEFEANCLNFNESQRASMTASSVQVRQKIHTNNIRKWQQFRNHLAPLIEIIESTDAEDLTLKT